jgi:hypothetical protein
MPPTQLKELRGAMEGATGLLEVLKDIWYIFSSRIFPSLPSSVGKPFERISQILKTPKTSPILPTFIFEHPKRIITNLFRRTTAFN